MKEKIIKDTIFIYDKDLIKPTQTRSLYLKEQVKRLLEIPQPEQRSQEWYELRDSMLTASDWATILGTSPYSNKNSLLLKKCGKNIPFPSNSAIDWGVKYEDVAVQIYESRNNNKVLLFGCLRHPTINYLGASPDGITEDGIMLEIKCPSSREITGEPPVYYWTQVQAQLEVCELDRCDFLECKLLEYDNKYDYENDHYNNDYTINSYGMEKGCVLELFNKETKIFSFQYSPLGIIGIELENWINNILNKFNKENNIFIISTISYWYLVKISCVPIYRNQEWFNSNLNLLKNFWDEILYWRKNGIEKLEEKINLEKKPSKRKQNNNKEFIDLGILDFDNNHSSSNNFDSLFSNNLFSSKTFNKEIKNNDSNYNIDTESDSDSDSSNLMIDSSLYINCFSKK